MKILFVGNSYTYYNDMPKLLEGLANANGHPAEVFAVTKGGRKLHQHLDVEDEYSRPLVELSDGRHHFDWVFCRSRAISHWKTLGGLQTACAGWRSVCAPLPQTG